MSFSCSKQNEYKYGSNNRLTLYRFAIYWEFLPMSLSSRNETRYCSRNYISSVLKLNYLMLLIFMKSVCVVSC